MPEDIRKTGPVGLKGLNRQQDVSSMSLEDQWKYVQSIPRSAYSSGPEENVGLAAMNAGYGQSQYDDAITSASQFEDINEIRYAEQPWYDTLANGLGKMLGTAGTTLVSSLVGLPVGIGTAIGEQRWSGLWDNSVTQAMGDVDDWLEENMKNYQSQAQQDAKWYQRFGDMNWWADNVIKNAGFALGAAGSMALGSGALGLMSKSLGFVDKVSKGGKVANQFLSSLFAATGEGMIEARQGVEERNKVEFQRLDEALAPEYNALDMAMQQAKQEYNATGDFKTYETQMNDLLAQRQVLDGRKTAGQQQIEESGRALGNQILLGNQVLLTAGNMIQFGKAMANSYDAARHAAETASKAAKPFGVTAVKTAEGTYKTVGKNFGRAAASLKGLLTEGSEEMNQQWIQSGATLYNTKEDVNDYWKAKLDPEAQKETTRGMHALGKAIAQGFDESWGDFDQWEQFFIGGLTGMAGTYSPTKIFNQDKTKSRLNPLRYGEWAGGAVNEIRDFNKEYKQYEENIDDLNKVLQQEDFFKRAGNFVARTFLETQKDSAAAENNRKAWEDADLKQNIHDIQAFLRAGKIDDLRAIYEDMGNNLSDEDVLNIINGTTKVTSAEDDKRQHDAVIDEQIAEKQRELDALYEEAGQLQTSLQGSVSDAVDVNRNYVNKQTQDIVRKIDQTQQDIAGLEFEKANYYGRTIYDGPYRGDTGYQTKTDDEIRAEVNNNAKELNRKLDSYLESVAAVNEATGGKLTKDQEDNLAYLHNIAKESIVESEKKIAGIREQLPTTFLLKTNKSPEQLTKEYAVSNLTFNKDESTKEGYVEVDTSLMDNSKFTNFFIRDVLWGGNIARELGQTADEKEEGTTVSEEAQKDAQEQNTENLNLILDNFANNVRGDSSASQQEKATTFNNMLADIADAAGYVIQAGDYYKTLSEYMANPEKVEEDKIKEEEKAQKEENTKTANNKFSNKSAKDIKGDVSNGDTSINDLNAFIQAANNGKLDVDENTIKAAKEAKDIIDKQNAVEGFIGTVENPTAAEDAKFIVQWAGNAVGNADEFNYDAVTNFDAVQLLSQSEIDYMRSQGYTEDQIIEQAEKRKQNAEDVLTDAFNALQKDFSKESIIPTGTEEAGVLDVDDTGKDGTTKSPSNLGNESAPPSPSPAPQELPTVSQSTAEAAIEESKTQEGPKGTNNGGTWRNNTRRYHYHKPVPYHETLSDKNSFRYKRSKAIYEYLLSKDAFEHSENASGDRLEPNDRVRFRIKSLADEIFGKPLSELSEEQRRQSMVIFMEDDKGNTVGDLPYPKLELNQDKEEVKMLQSLYDKATDALLAKNAKDGITEARLDGKGGLDMKFKNGTPLVGEIFEVLRGTAPYTDKNDTRSLNEIAGIDTTGRVAPFGLAIKVVDGQINVGPRKVANTVGVGKVGQPYYLLPDASGRPVAVPFATPLFNAESMKDTSLYSLLKESLSQLERHTDPSKGKEERNRAINTICSLLQIENPFLAIGDHVVLSYKNLGNPSEKRITIEKTDDWKDALLGRLDGTPIQVSLNRINGNISVGGLTRNYNEVIGEVAYTSLPANTRHTVGSWFTLKNFSDKKERTRRVTYPEGVTQDYTLPGGRVVTITTGNVWTAADPKTGEPIEGDTSVDLALAEMQAINRGVTEGRIKVDINGKTKTYDVTNKRLEAPSAIRNESPSVSTVEDTDIPIVPQNWKPEGMESAEAPQTNNTAIEEVKEERGAEGNRYSTVAEAEDVAKKLKILDARKTKYAWELLDDNTKIALMNGNDVTISMDNQIKTLSLNSVPETIKILQEWNKAAKDNPSSFETRVLYRKADDADARKADIAREKRWLQKNLPMFNTEDRLNLTKGLLNIPGSEEKAWGRFEQGVITLSEAAAAGTLYHEAFHAVTQTLLSDDSLNELYDAARKYYKEKDPAIVEELLAEDFRRYVQREETPVIGTLLRVFRKILNAIRNIGNYNAPIHQLFYKINNGEFRDMIPNEPREGNAFYSIYNDRVNPELLSSNSPRVEAIIADFRKHKELIGGKLMTGKKWSAFKEKWENTGEYILEGHWSQRLVDKDSYVLKDIKIRSGNRYVSVAEANRDKRDAIEYENRYIARRAREAKKELLSWDRLSTEQQSSLYNLGFSKSVYDKMSLEEQEQILYCNS